MSKYWIRRRLESLQVARYTMQPATTPLESPRLASVARLVAVLASLRSAAVLTSSGFPKRAGPFHSHPGGWAGQRTLAVGQISAPLAVGQGSAPLAVGQGSAPRHGRRQPHPPQPIRSFAPIGAHSESLARALLARAPPLPRGRIHLTVPPLRRFPRPSEWNPGTPAGQIRRFLTRISLSLCYRLGFKRAAGTWAHE